LSTNIIVTGLFNVGVCCDFLCLIICVVFPNFLFYPSSIAPVHLMWDHHSSIRSSPQVPAPSILVQDQGSTPTHIVSLSPVTIRTCDLNSRNTHKLFNPLRYHPPVSPSVPAPVPTAGPTFYPGQTLFSHSPSIIVPTQQQPQPTRREKKTICIRDPNQGGKDITAEILAGGSGSRNSTPPVGPPSSTPTPPQPEAPLERLEADVSVSEPSTSVEPELSFHASLTTVVALPPTAANASPSARKSTASVSSSGESKSSLVASHMPNTDKTLPDSPQNFAASPSAAPKALNGLADSGIDLDVVAHEPSLLPPAALHPPAPAPAYRDASSSETVPTDMRPEVPIAAALSPLSPVAVVPVTLTLSPLPTLPVMLPPGLPPLVQATAEADEPSKTPEVKDLMSKGELEPQGGISESKVESQQQALTRRSPTTGKGYVLPAPLSCSPVPLPSVFPTAAASAPAPTSSPQADGNSTVSEENGEAESEPLRNGAGHTSETESSDSGATPVDKEISMGAPQDELFRKVRSILNKLTPQKFNQLMKQVTDLTIDTEERLKGVIDLVFEKAIDEPSFSVAYGQMCRCLATLKVQMMDKPNSTVNFRKLLLNRCQKEFEKDKADDVVFERKQKELDSAASVCKRERLQEELEEAKDKARRRSIGNIKFIGELFKLKMLTEAIMHDCVVKLLKNHDEESLECLCRLLTTIGKDLDFEKAKMIHTRSYRFNGACFLREVCFIVSVSFRTYRNVILAVHVMLWRTVLHLRLWFLSLLLQIVLTWYFNTFMSHLTVCFTLQHNWVSRRADQGPKTIEQIHKEAKIEEQEEQRKVHQQLLSKDSKRRPGRLPVRTACGVLIVLSSRPEVPPTPSHLSVDLEYFIMCDRNYPREQRESRKDETWNTVPMTKNSRSIDPNKIPKISKPQMDEKIQLGPRAQVTWVKGSSGGAKASDSGKMPQQLTNEQDSIYSIESKMHLKAIN
ncbi:hypothetical protein GOODEAATRI_003374, partial [Goodea atripinnis]